MFTSALIGAWKRNFPPVQEIIKDTLRGGVVLGGAHHKVAYPTPQPPKLWSNYHFFVGFFFRLESPDTEK